MKQPLDNGDYQRRLVLKYWLQCEFENEDDETCKGCKNKRKQSLIGKCIRTRLPDLTPIFIPGELSTHDGCETITSSSPASKPR